MEKVISVVRSNNKCNQDGSTILSRYKSLADLNGGELPPAKLYKFLAGENARIMNKRRGDDSLDDHTLEECKVFAAFYVSRVSLEARRSMVNRFGGLPNFLRTGVSELSKNPPAFPWNTPLNLTDEQLIQANSFVKYVEGLDVNRIATICVKNPGNNQESKEVIPLSRDMSSEGMKTRRGLFLAYVGYMIQYEGSILLRLCFSKEEFVVMGFRAQNGKLRPISAEQIEQIFNKPNTNATKNVTFRTPDWT